MKEPPFSELIFLPIQIGSTDPDCVMLFGDRLEELSMEKAIFHTDTMKTLIDVLGERFSQADPSKKISDIRKLLLRGFVYCFDKAVENIYNIRVRPAAEISFDLNDLIYGEGGDKIPEFLQLKVTPHIGTIAKIYNKLVEYVEENEAGLYKSEVSFAELIKSILYGGMYLGTEFCLRLNLHNIEEIDEL